MRSFRLTLAFGSSLLFLTPTRIHAQATAATAIAFGGVDKFLDRIESVDLYYGWNGWQRKPTAGRYTVPFKDEFGLEFSLHVGSFGNVLQDALTAEKTKIAKAMAEAKAVSRADSVRVMARLYPEWKNSSLTVKKHYAVVGGTTIVTGVDSEFVAVPNIPKLPRTVDLDFALGYGQLNGVKTNQPYELRGYVRELPSVSLYATFWKTSALGAYIGFRTGVITLQDAQLFVPPDSARKIFTLSATSFEVGGAFGLVIPIGNSDDGPSVTLEASPMWRNFNSVVSNPAANTPVNMPHSIDLSGVSISIGVMFPIPKASK